MKKLNLEYIYEYQAKQYSFMQLPMLLITGEEFRELDYGCKILYGLLLSRVSLSLNAKNRDKFMDEKGRVFILFSSKEIADKMKCSRRSAVKYIRLLEDYGLIELREENGYSSKIFVKDFAGVQNNTSKETESSVNEAEGTYAKVAYPPMQSLHTPRAKFAHPNKIDRKIYIDNIYNKQKNPSITQEVYRGLGKRGNIDLSKAEYDAIINDFGKDRGLELIDIVSDKIFSRGKENEKIRYIYPYIKKVAESLGYMELSKIKKDVVITENSLNAYYLELQKKAENKAINNRKEIDNISDIKKIWTELNRLNIKKLIARAQGKNQVIIDKIAKDISSKEQQKKMLYKKYGIDEENFKAKFRCDKCDDTGYVKGSNKPCSCRADRENELREKILRRKLQEGI